MLLLLLFALALVLGDLYVRNKFRFVGDRKPKERDSILIRFLQRYEPVLRVGGLIAIFASFAFARTGVESIHHYWGVALICGGGLSALIAATVWPLLRWRR